MFFGIPENWEGLIPQPIQETIDKITLPLIHHSIYFFERNTSARISCNESCTWWIYEDNYWDFEVNFLF